MFFYQPWLSYIQIFIRIKMQYKVETEKTYIYTEKNKIKHNKTHNIKKHNVPNYRSTIDLNQNSSCMLSTTQQELIRR